MRPRQYSPMIHRLQLHTRLLRICEKESSRRPRITSLSFSLVSMISLQYSSLDV